MTKAALRQEFLAKRKALLADEVSSRSLLITRQFIDFCEKSPLATSTAIIHTFLPIQRQNEVDTWPIIESIWGQFQQTQLAVSITDTTEKQLIHYPFYPSTILQTNRWGIPEPIHNGQLPIDSRQIDIVLVPLLVFDKQGHRIGYGGGYYDRFLANCRPDCLKLGLSLFEPVDMISDVEITDVPLNSCIVPHKKYFFD